ncbi:MAG: FG-GAP-like repeat-containing protein [Verrucomicrobiia bacterium]
MAYPGDVNGDGFSDVAIGGPLENESRGIVAIFHGGATGLHQQPDWTRAGLSTGVQFGVSVAFGDVNGDGFGDLIVAEYPFGPDSLAQFPVQVFYGSTNGLAREPSQSLPGKLGRDHLCLPVAIVGDVNGDGFADLACAGFSYEHETKFPVVVMVALFHGSREGLSLLPAKIIRAEKADSSFGTALGCAGDVNGDGYDDLFIGAKAYTGRYQQGGKAYVYLGSPEGVRSEPSWTAEYPLSVTPGVDDEKKQLFSYGIGAAGDVNRDGFADLLVGAAFASHGEINEGAVFLYLGSKEGLRPSPAWHAESNQPHSMFGASVSGAGDLNGDGFDDVVIGAPQAENGQKDEGVALVFYGCKQGLALHPAWTFDGDLSNGRIGEPVLGAGDLNGDGAPDLVLAGLDSQTLSEPRTRVMAIYGTKGGLRNSSNWRIQKPFLAAAQQWLDRASRGTFWIGSTALAATAILFLIFVQAKLRSRLAILMERNRELVLAEERTRLARDVHDHLGADLTHLAVQLEAARRQPTPEGMKESLGGLSSYARRLLDTVRELVWATRPECDTLESVASYLSEQIATFLEAHDIQCDLDFPLEIQSRPVSANLRHNLLLMVKEALHNLVQHASATRVEVWLRIEARNLHVGIRDNGRGFDPPTAMRNNDEGNGRTQRTGFGLRNLAARAASLGGRCVIYSRPGSGTTIEFVLPIEFTTQTT